THAKRKKIKQERRKACESGIVFRWKVGREITEADWRFFTRCYNLTYRAHLSSPYLNLAFFARLGHVLPEHLLLVSPSGKASRSQAHLTSSPARPFTVGTGAPPATCRACTSRPATTRRSSSASRAGSASSRAARKASTSSRAASSRR